MNWLPYNTAMDVVLRPATRVNFLMYPYAETPKSRIPMSRISSATRSVCEIVA